MRRLALALLLTLGAALLGACRREEAALGKAGSPLVIVLSPGHGADGRAIGELEALLEREAGLELELRVAPGSEAAVRMAGSPNTDAALLTLFEYLFCRQLHEVSAGLRVVRKDGALTHRGEIVVRRDDAPRALADLAGKKVAFVDRYSSTGYVLPAKQLHDAGVKVDAVFAGTHEAALSELRAGRVAAAATWAGASAGAPDIRRLTETAEIPNEPVFFRKGLDPDTRRRLEAALVRAASTAEGRRVLGRMANIEGWVISNEHQRKPADLAP